MQDLFATAFDVAATDLDERFAEIAREVASWAWRGDGDAPNVLNEQGGTASGHQDYRMGWQLLQVPEHVERVLEVTLHHPDSDNPALEWRTRVDVCRAIDGISVTVRIGREATEHVLAPAGLVLRRPGVVPRLLEAFDCTADAVSVKVTATAVPVGSVEGFASAVLREPSRRLPAVVLAPAEGTRPTVDPQALADELAGLAHVYYLGGYLAWRRFREAVGHENRIPRGGARIYWPGFGVEEDNLRHRFWTEDAVQDSTPTFDRSVFRMLARLSVGAVPRDPRIGDLQRARARHRREELSTALGNAEDRAFYDEIAEENDRLADANSQLVDQVSELERIKAAYEQAWAATPERAARDLDLPEDDEQLLGAIPGSWPEVARRLPELVSEAFVLTPRAREQCSSNPYPDPARMWEELRGLAEAADDYRARNARVGNRLADWLSERHELDVRPFDRRLDGRFEYDGVTYYYSRLPHVAVDDHKDPSRCGRIYFAADDAHGRFIVDHIGLHL